MSESKFEITKDNDRLTLANSEFFADSDDKWVGSALDEDRIIIASEKSQGDMRVGGKKLGVMQCSPEMLLDFLLGLHRRRWSGAVCVDTKNGVKKIYFGAGEVVFAGSNMIDDRLGEVIYREALITLDELTNSAAQVDRKTKFGQVLLSSNIFSNSALYRALQLQVRQIMRSVFMVTSVYVEVSAGSGLAPTEVVFDEGTSELLDECFSYGIVFRDFLARLREDTLVELTDFDGSTGLAAGTFKGDLLEMIKDHKTIPKILETSKLIDLNTTAAIADLVFEGICKLPNAAQAERPGQSPELSPLKAKIDAFYVLNATVRKAFAAGGKQFPVEEIRTFTRGLNPRGFVSVFLDEVGQIAKDSSAVMFSQCRVNHNRVQYFAVRIESLNQFLLQLAGDMLSFDIAKGIRAEYRGMMS